MSNELIQLRCNMYLLIARLLRDAPDSQLLHWLQEIDLFSENEFSQALPHHSEISSNVPSIDQAWFELQQAANTYSELNVIDEYQQLFIGIGRGEVVPFGSWHLTGSLMEKPLAKLRHDLSLLGFERQHEVKEPEDHLAALCEVMALLLESDDQTHMALIPSFFNEHIGTWYQSFIEQLLAASNTKFYRSVASFIAAFLYIEQVRFSQPSADVHSNKITVKNHIDVT